MKQLGILVLLAFFQFGCGNSTKDKLFVVRHAGETGICFENRITSNDSVNALSFEYIYNGSGVGVGDFNNDGREDLFFGGNEVSSELYLNKGNLKFENVTKASGVQTNRWVTGVSVIDINRDGLLDVYLCVGGWTTAENRQNILFVNQGVRDGIPSFKEMAVDYKLNDDSYSTMAAFFDYDSDGDADLYLLNNWLERYNRNNIRPKRINAEAESTDRLYRNNGDGTFSDVSKAAGILIEGYGLGVTVCDINEDNLPDVYVANDFLSNDLLWLNQGDGTFRNVISEYLRHQTHNAMGVDIADFNNDALPDIVVVDMLPEGHHRQKMMTAGQNYDHFHMSMKSGFEPQYMRNTLQLNRGKTPDGKVLFSEIAFHSGVAQTDWSWAPLFADFDNDGWKDLFVANGYRKDVTNVDFIFFGLQNNNPFGTPAARKKVTQDEFNKLEEVKISNYVFRNTGTLRFEDKTHEWGLEHETFSNGAAYADLDNDGDLDLVTNNIDQEVIIHENTSPSTKRSIAVVNKDTASFNQKVRVYVNGTMQLQEYTPYRGFQSTVTQRMHFGLGSAGQADSVVVEWTNGKTALYTNVKAGSTIAYTVADARHRAAPAPATQLTFEFKPRNTIEYVHHEASPSDIKVTRTLVHELSRNGPCLATGDVNGDALDDLFIGGEDGLPSLLLIQNADGTFRKTTLPGDTAHEDGAAVFFDANGDGRLDLYVASASPTAYTSAGQHRLFLNDGRGEFRLSDLPGITVSSGCVVPIDYDGDRDLDLFIGGNLEPAKYPIPSRSFLLQNKGGTFHDVTEQVAPLLVQPGLISSAVAADLNRDGKDDLVIAGEWMPIRVFINDGKTFSEKTKEFGLADTHGWWNCLKTVDVNGDGYTDVVAGNAGTNTFFEASVSKPVRIMAKDFDKNDSFDPLVTYFNPIEKDRFLLHNRLVLIDQIPAMKKRFETFGKYASTPLDGVFRPEEIEGTYTAEVTMMESITLFNKGGSSFAIKALPEKAQLSTLNDFLMDDFDNDGVTDFIGVGNRHDRETLYGNFDASVGVLLTATRNGDWIEREPLKHKFIATGDARKIGQIRTASGTAIVIVNNNGPLQMFDVSQPRISGMIVQK